MPKYEFLTDVRPLAQLFTRLYVCAHAHIHAFLCLMSRLRCKANPSKQMAAFQQSIFISLPWGEMGQGWRRRAVHLAVTVIFRLPPGLAEGESPREDSIVRRSTACLLLAR